MADLAVCAACHNTASAKDGVKLDTYANAKAYASAAASAVTDDMAQYAGANASKIRSDLLAWIAAGYPQGSAPAPAPPPPAPPPPAPGPPPPPAPGITYTSTISADLAKCTVCHNPAGVYPAVDLSTLAGAKTNATLAAAAVVSNMQSFAGLTTAQAQQIQADINAWIAAGYPQ